ncbi:hypothetical protein LCGC14_1380700 [marine sediment metagenome]|uniref:Uncharacterized protein n=1 Tax=marine sediment metagenome TaxID=412755 RepID=A0A0F9K360_9ZZZZ
MGIKYTKYWIVIFATSLAVIFTALIHLMPDHAMMWLYIEVIVLPIIYYIGYEVLMEKQKESFERDADKMIEKAIAVRDYAISVEKETAKLKYKYDLKGKYGTKKRK